MFGGRPSLRSAQKGHTTFLDPETLSLLRSGPRNRWEGLLIGDWDNVNVFIVAKFGLWLMVLSSTHSALDIGNIVNTAHSI